MVDAHVHLEKGDYTVEWVQQFVDYAVQRNINEIFFLEHIHIFRECTSLYDEMSSYNEYQRDWYQKKWEQARPLSEYIDFIEKLKQHEFSVRLKFGFEVCYSPEHEKDISEIGRYVKEMNDIIKQGALWNGGNASMRKNRGWQHDTVRFISSRKVW